MRNAVFASFAVLAALTLAGCAAETSGDTAEGSADLEAAAALPHGFYGLGSQTGFRWINLLNLHGDGSFEGSMGDSVSNLSGHQFNANGTYAVKTIGGKPTLELHYVFVGPAPELEHYVISGSPGAPTLRFDQEDGTLDEPFTMRALPAPATISFNESAAPHVDGTITHGSPLLLMYAADRDQCPVSNATESVFMMGKAPGAPIGRDQIGGAFPLKPVNGSFRLLTFAPPAGPTLSLWFENVTAPQDGAPTCSKWDSNFGANYSFDMH